MAIGFAKLSHYRPTSFLTLRNSYFKSAQIMDYTSLPEKVIFSTNGDPSVIFRS